MEKSNEKTSKELGEELNGELNKKLNIRDIKKKKRLDVKVNSATDLVKIIEAIAE